MSEDHTITFNLDVDNSMARTSMGELNRLMTTYVALARRAGLPENVMETIRILQQLRIAFEMAYRSAMLFYAATGPVGWAIGLGGMAMSGMMLVDQMEMGRARY